MSQLDWCLRCTGNEHDPYCPAYEAPFIIRTVENTHIIMGSTGLGWTLLGWAQKFHADEPRAQQKDQSFRQLRSGTANLNRTARAETSGTRRLWVSALLKRLILPSLVHRRGRSSVTYDFAGSAFASAGATILVAQSSDKIVLILYGTGTRLVLSAKATMSERYISNGDESCSWRNYF